MTPSQLITATRRSVKTNNHFQTFRRLGPLNMKDIFRSFSENTFSLLLHIRLDVIFDAIFVLRQSVDHLLE